MYKPCSSRYLTLSKMKRSINPLLFLCVLSCVSTDISFTILHVGDLHSKFEEVNHIFDACNSEDKRRNECFGGFARIAHVVRNYRRLSHDPNGSEVIFLNAGDVFTGSNLFNIRKAKIASDLINLLQPNVSVRILPDRSVDLFAGNSTKVEKINPSIHSGALCHSVLLLICNLDSMYRQMSSNDELLAWNNRHALHLFQFTLGNHEMLYGIQELESYTSSLSSPLVAANVKFPEDPKYSNIKKSVVLDLNNTKIGIIGYLSTAATKPINLEFIDEVEALKAESEYLNAQGIKILVALGHSGIFIDEKIASEVPLIDLIVGGHTHTLLYNGTPPSSDKAFDVYPKIVTQPNGKRVPIVHAYAFTKYLGCLNVTFNADGELINYSGNPVFMSPDTPQEEDVLDLLEEFRLEIRALESEILGNTKVCLVGRNNSCRHSECNFGNLITDALVAYISTEKSSQYGTDVPIGIINGAAIRNSIDIGDITRSDISSSLPFPNQVVTCSIKGHHLIRTLELATRNNGTTSLSEFLQFSGLHVSYNLSHPPGSRVVKAEVRCGNYEVSEYEEIKGDFIYNIVTTTFLANGGSGHRELRDNCYNKTTVDSLTDKDILIWYLKNYSPISTELEQRIKFVGDANIYKNTFL